MATALLTGPMVEPPVALVAVTTHVIDLPASPATGVYVLLFVPTLAAALFH
jgi:hypothetical protein